MVSNWLFLLCEFSAPFAYLAVKKESYRKGAKNAKEPLDTVYGIADPLHHFGLGKRRGTFQAEI